MAPCWTHWTGSQIMKKGIADAMTDRIGEFSPNLGHTVGSNTSIYNIDSRIF